MQWIPPASLRCRQIPDVLQFAADLPDQGLALAINSSPPYNRRDVREKEADMPVVAVINRKGGSGKSTLATQLAGYCANAGVAVMLGDVDRQQSTQTWLRQRKAQPLRPRQKIVGWTVDPRTFVRPPAGIEHVILDTPGGLRGFDLARVVMYADAILMPVCNSIFDRESAAECLAELRTLPRVSTGRCKVAAVGMRIDARTKSAEVLQAWAASLNLPFIAVLRESQAYVRCIEKGLSLFDLTAAQVQTDLAQWKPILDWLRSVMQPAPRAVDDVQRGAPLVARDAAARPAPVREPGRREPDPAAPVSQPAPRPLEPARRAGPASPMSRLLDALPIPRFLQRTP
jgi:chromosome partitioning protein